MKNMAEVVRRMPLINKAFPNDFNYSIGEGVILEKYDRYLPIPENYSFSVIQPCIRITDFLKQVQNNSLNHLGLFEMADVGGLRLFDNKKSLIIKEKSIEIAYDFIVNDLGLAPESIYVNYFSGNSIKNLSKNKIISNRYIAADIETVNVWKSLGLKEHQFIPDDTEKTFVLAFLPFEFYAGYRSELFIKSHSYNNLFELGTFEFLDFQTKLNKEGKLIDITNLDGCFGGMAIGIERALLIVNGFNNIFQCDHISPLYDKVLSLSKEKNELASRIVTEGIRMLSAINFDPIIMLNDKIPAGRRRRRNLKKIYDALHANAALLKLNLEKNWEEIFWLNIKLQPWYFSKEEKIFSLDKYR